MSAQMTIPLVQAPDYTKSQWFTPQDLADRVVRWAGVNAATLVLEPCAGRGALAKPMLDLGADVTCVEVDPALTCAWNFDLTLRPTPRLVQADFLGLSPVNLDAPFDLVVMNSPFENGQDAVWLEHALRFAPRIVAIEPSRIFYGKDKHRRVWAHNGLARVAHLVSRPFFGGPYGQGRTDFCVVDVRRGYSGPTTEERAAIMEHMGGIPRKKAEAFALERVELRRLRAMDTQISLPLGEKKCT